MPSCVLTIPLAADSPVAAIRFTSTRTYWTETFPRLGIDLVREEAFRRAERLAEHGLAPTTAVALCDLRAPSAVLTREQWAVACRIGAHASALDLAARRGTALIDTLECLGSLTRAGLCAPVRAGGRGQPCRAGCQRGAASPGRRHSRRPHRRRCLAACPRVTRRRIARPGPAAPGSRRRSTSCARC